MKRIHLMAVSILTAALVLGGCGAASHNNASESYPAFQSSGAAPMMSAAKEEAAYDAEEYDFGAEAEPAMDAAADSAEIAAGGGNGDGNEGTLQQAQDGQKIVYTGNITIQTLEYDKAKASIHAKIKSAGGFIESENENDNDYNWYNYTSSSSRQTRTLYITARVPSAQFEPFLDSISGDGKVLSRSVNAENISQVYADTKTYKEALEKEEARLLQMMDKAETIEDMIAVESRLSTVERQLNQYKTSLATMDKQVEYSTISISLEEVKRYSQEVQEVTFAEQVSRAFTDAIESFTLFCQGIVLFAVRYFPYLIILLIIIVLIILAARRAKAKRIAMMMDPEYAKAMNARQRARAEKIAQKQAKKQAQKEAQKNAKNTAEGGKRVYKRLPAENEAGQDAVNPANDAGTGADSNGSVAGGAAAVDSAEGTAAASTAADKATAAPEAPAGQVDSGSPDRSDK